MRLAHSRHRREEFLGRLYCLGNILRRMRRGNKPLERQNGGETGRVRLAGETEAGPGADSRGRLPVPCIIQNQVRLAVVVDVAGYDLRVARRRTSHAVA